MTNQEFDRAIEALRQGNITARERRVIAAAVFIMRELSNMPEAEAEAWEPTRMQILEFINSLDKQLRSLLKRIADDVQEEKPTLH
jgi:cell division protein ZapA (FtsZ GTPase activity inhibitor)